MRDITTRTVEEISADIRNANSRVGAIDKEIGEIEAKLAELKKERTELAGSLWKSDYSKISRLQGELEQAKLRDAQSKAKVVVWKNGCNDSDKYVVSRVTEKRIYVSLFGHSSETQYNKDGTQVSRSYNPRSIDIEKTFGGSLEA